MGVPDPRGRGDLRQNPRPGVRPRSMLRRLRQKSTQWRCVACVGRKPSISVFGDSQASVIESWSQDEATSLSLHAPVVPTRLVKLRISISRSNQRLRHRSPQRSRVRRWDCGPAADVDNCRPDIESCRQIGRTSRITALDWRVTDRSMRSIDNRASDYSRPEQHYNQHATPHVAVRDLKLELATFKKFNSWNLSKIIVNFDQKPSWDQSRKTRMFSFSNVRLSVI